jgi:hypothetical protein
VAGCTAMVMTALVAGAMAQPGIPDFSSNGTAWKSPNGQDYVAAPGSPPPVTNDPAHPYISNGEATRTGKQPTYRIADLRNPNLKQWAKDALKKDNDEVLKGKIAYTPGSSCKPWGVPAVWLSGGPFYFVQTPKMVWIIEIGDRLARRVYLNVPHSPNPKPSWYGESVGRYEGDTLVIDTIGFNGKAFVDNYRTPHTQKLHVVERIRLIEGGKKLEVRMRVEDPDTFNQPWEVVRTFDREQSDEFYEEVCEEGNHMLFDYGIPVSDKPEF